MPYVFVRFMDSVAGSVTSKQVFFFFFKNKANSTQAQQKECATYALINWYKIKLRD